MQLEGYLCEKDPGGGYTHPAGGPFITTDYLKLPLYALGNPHNFIPVPHDGGLKVIDLV